MEYNSEQSRSERMQLELGLTGDLLGSKTERIVCLFEELEQLKVPSKYEITFAAIAGMVLIISFILATKLGRIDEFGYLLLPFCMVVVILFYLNPRHKLESSTKRKIRRCYHSLAAILMNTGGIILCCRGNSIKYLGIGFDDEYYYEEYDYRRLRKITHLRLYSDIHDIEHPDGEVPTRFLKNWYKANDTLLIAEYSTPEHPQWELKAFELVFAPESSTEELDLFIQNLNDLTAEISRYNKKCGNQSE